MEMEVGIAIVAMEMDRLLVDNVAEKVGSATNVIYVTVLEKIPSKLERNLLSKNDNKMLKEDAEEIKGEVVEKLEKENEKEKEKEKGVLSVEKLAAKIEKSKQEGKKEKLEKIDNFIKYNNS